MTELVDLTVMGVWGATLGLVFFGGLWLTIERGLRSEFAAFWFLGSLLIRTAVVLGGIYLVAQGDWENLAACLLGFLVARMTITRFLSWKRGRSCI